MSSIQTTPKRAGGERRGNSKDRAVRRAFLLAWWGDGEVCQCVYCGVVLRDVPLAEQGAHGECHPGHVTADKIMPYEGGPGYVRSNIVPACFACNNVRGDRGFVEFACSVGVDAEAVLAHAEASPKRGFTRR